ncbi:MAG: hypothetical protein IPM48_00815 [Saprospiraceae bacterium]|nr:hypothetical protein [Saprospiraceae bacterium]
MLANILLLISIFIYFSTANLILKGQPGGDAGVGYAWAYIISLLGFVLFSGLLAWSMNYNHFFDGVFSPGFKYKNWLVFIGWAAFVASAFWSLEYRESRNEPGFLFFMHWLAKSKMYVWLPLIVFSACFYLINFQIKSAHFPIWLIAQIKIGFFVSLAVGSVVLLTYGNLMIKDKINRISSRLSWILESRKESEEEYRQALQYVEGFRESKVDGLLKYVLAFKPELRNKAIDKIKSIPNHEEDMLAILTNKEFEEAFIYGDNTQYVYAYLVENNVSDPEKFVKALIINLEASARRTERDLEDPYSWEMGLLNLETVCQVLDRQFKNHAQEFKPVILNIQKILSVDVPERKNKRINRHYKKKLKTFRKAISDWIERN